MKNILLIALIISFIPALGHARLRDATPVDVLQTEVESEEAGNDSFSSVMTITNLGDLKNGAEAYNNLVESTTSDDETLWRDAALGSQNETVDGAGETTKSNEVSF